MTRKRCWFPALAGLVCLMAVAAHAASPRLNLIQPRGVQRGREHVLTFGGSQLRDAEEILFFDPGFEVEKLQAADKQVKVYVTVAPDCRLGEHLAQLRTASGVSDFRTFYVEGLPAVAEKEPNSDFSEPQPVELNVIVDGVVQREDVDYFVVQARQGQRITVEVFGMRLGEALFDPYIAVSDAKGFELAASDDTALALQDPFISLIAPADGRYVIEVRDSAYGGAGNFRYRLHVGEFPRPSAVYPAGGQRGQPLQVRYLGDAAGDLLQQLTPPNDPREQIGLWAADAGGQAPSPNQFRLSDYGNALEQEPNNALREATPAELPLAMNGVIQSPGDVDSFRVQAKKGQVFNVECYARRVRSELDSVMTIYSAGGKRVASNDDSRGPDSYLQWKVADDGQYVVQVTDQLGRGGPDYVYRVEFQPPTPQLTLGIPRVERYGQYRQTIFVPRGNRFGVVFTANRTNFGGELIFEGDDLPPGLRLSTEPMAANLNVAPVVFEAAADAPIGGKLVDFTARLADPQRNIRGGFRNVADLVRGQPGQSIYYTAEADRLAVVVVQEAPFQLEIAQPEAPLVRNGSMQLRVAARRQQGFTAPITVEFPFRPPGVGAASSIKIPEGQDEALYPVNASGNAQLNQWKVFVLGAADVGGQAWVSSQLATLEVAEPYVACEMKRASCEQGQTTQIYCRLNQLRDFPGSATARLQGLPTKVAAEPLQFTKDDAQLVFTVQTDPSSPVGKHRNVYCQVEIPCQDESIVSRAGETELQIDKPLPAASSSSAPPTTPETTAAQPADKKDKPQEKPLSRLEKLRLAAQQPTPATADQP